MRREGIWFYYQEICYDARSHERKILALTCGVIFCVNLSNLQQIDFNIKCVFGLLCGAFSCLANYPEFKDTNGRQEKGNHYCECGNTVLSSIVPFPFVFAFKETSVLPEISQTREEKNEAASWLRAQTADFCDIGTQKLVPRLKKCLDKCGDYVEK